MFKNSINLYVFLFIHSVCTRDSQSVILLQLLYEKEKENIVTVKYLQLQM